MLYTYTTLTPTLTLTQVHGLAVNKDMEKKTDDAGDKSLFKFPFRFSKESKNKMQMAKETTEASNEG